jgi:hypothetical protein
MRRALILLVLLLAIGIGVFAPSQAQTSGGRNPCVARCREAFRDAHERCRNLPPAERKECLRAAKERFEACRLNCR